jgi:hypothetical protein
MRQSTVVATPFTLSRDTGSGKHALDSDKRQSEDIFEIPGPAGFFNLSLMNSLRHND